MDPYEFFALASNLVGRSPDESSARTAVGRAYYACWLTARDRMFGKDGVRLRPGKLKQILRGRRGASHEAVLTAVGQNGALTPGNRKTMSDQLRELRDLRVQADYYCAAAPTSLFSRYAVNDWEGLAHTSLALASNVYPQVKKLTRHR